MSDGQAGPAQLSVPSAGGAVSPKCTCRSGSRQRLWYALLLPHRDFRLIPVGCVCGWGGCGWATDPSALNLALLMCCVSPQAACRSEIQVGDRCECSGHRAKKTCVSMGSLQRFCLRGYLRWRFQMGCNGHVFCGSSSLFHVKRCSCVRLRVMSL